MCVVMGKWTGQSQAIKRKALTIDLHFHKICQRFSKYVCLKYYNMSLQIYTFHFWVYRYNCN